MKPLYVVPLSLGLLAMLLATDVDAQNRRGRQGRRGVRGSQQGNQYNGRGRSDTSRISGTISTAERQGLILMREEEKLARDVYLTLQDKWGDSVFGTIAGAESRHMSALKNLLNRYGIADPVTDDTIGVFNSEKFHQLYRRLVAAGSKSLVDAYKIGLTIEELDIADLRSEIRESTLPDVIRVYENLERGSRNHLRAFDSRLKSVGGLYTAAYLPQNEFDQIANSSHERGGGGGGRGRQQGQRKGKGKGRGN